MALFIILPFVGGYIGYTFAPEKVVEKEVIREVETASEANLNAGSTSDTDGRYHIISEPTPSLERVIEILQRPSQTSIPDFNLDTDADPRDMLYPGIGADGIPTVDSEMLATRNKPMNCWVLLNGFVHDITPLFALVDELPAIEQLGERCGTDITEFLADQPVREGALGTARFKYVLAVFSIVLGVEEK